MCFKRFFRKMKLSKINKRTGDCRVGAHSLRGTRCASYTENDFKSFHEKRISNNLPEVGHLLVRPICLR